MSKILILTRNNLNLTKMCFESVRRQSVCPNVLIYDNGSSDGTPMWLKENKHPATFDYQDFMSNLGVSKGWNCGLYELFHNRQAAHVLVIGNDTVIPPWFYSELLSYDAPFVTGTSTEDMDALAIKPLKAPLIPHPDFSAFLIRRDAWEKIGPFDDAMVSWASDCDYHVRAHQLGIPLYKAYLPFYHERSSTIRLAPPKERRMMEMQADADRETFRIKYGCLPGTPEYAELFR